MRVLAAALVIPFAAVPSGPPMAKVAACAHSVPSGVAASNYGEATAQGIGRAIRGGEKLDHTGRPISGLPYGLAQGVVGVLGTAETGFTIVVDQAVLDEKQFRLRLEQHLPPGSARDIPLEPSCRSVAELASAWTRLGDRDWHPEARRTTFVADLDVRTERITVGINPRTRAAVMRAAYDIDPDVVRVQPTGSTRLSRLSDSAKGGHWGGARVVSARELCSAGFSVVRRSSGHRGSVTAGHCGPNGTRWRSGKHFYGTGSNRHDYPDYDQQLLVGSAYGAKIWTDGPGDNEDVRTVKGANDPAVGQQVCASGSFTRSVCGIRVESLSAKYCDSDGCTTYVLRGSRRGTVVVHTGDSGGPVYSRPSSDAAIIRGMIFAGTGCHSSGCTTLFAERYDSISGHLKVRAVTG